MRASYYWMPAIGLLLSLPASPLSLQTRMQLAMVDSEEVRAGLEEAIELRRRRAGLAPVAPAPLVARAAQEEADAIARRLEGGTPLVDAASDDGLEKRLVDLGYEPLAFEAAIALSDAQPEVIVERMMGDAPGLGELWRADLPDIGIGIAESGRSLVYLVVLALSEPERFAAETRELGDLDALRAAHLAEVNRARHEAGRGRVEPDACLDRVAQEYADRMLSEGFFGHVDDDGRDVTDRVRAGGCPHRPVGENLALGPNRIEVVVGGWLESPSHRRVLMEPLFDAIGLGLAFGRGPDGYRIIWVEVLGERDPEAP